MTRFLSESLKAPEPYFGLHLRSLERARGNPGADIKLSSTVMLEVKDKLKQLTLDAHDTTAKELYLAVDSRLKTDDVVLTRKLRTLAATHISAEAEVVAGMTHALRATLADKQCFALKPVAGKRLIKSNPPKKTMKKLGYRSVESMLKQESLASIMAAAGLTETVTWRRKLNDSYKKLTPKDFETRQLQIIHPSGKKWRELTDNAVNDQKHNILSFPILGSLVLLPLPKDTPAGVVTASLALALRACNQIHSTGSYLKLCQMRPDFGQVVRSVDTKEPILKTNLLDHKVSWQVVQKFYARAQQYAHSDIFASHISREDLSWQGVEQAISSIEPKLAFWHDSSFLGVVHGKEVVSLNIIDAALNACNGLSFENRLAGHFRESLWHELQLQYLHPETVEQTVMAEIQPKLAYAPALA